MKFVRNVVCCFLIPVCLYGQLSDTQLFRSAISASSDTAKLATLDRLIAEYPQSRILGEAYRARFSVLLSLHRDSAAFYAAHRYLAAKDSVNLQGALQEIALELAFRKEYADTALKFVDSAISIYSEKHNGPTSLLLYTKATALIILKRFSEAEAVQQGAMRLLPPSALFDPQYGSYYSLLGLIQLETHRGVEGLEQYVRASFVSRQPSTDYSGLDSLFHSRLKDSTVAAHVRDSLFERVGNEYLRAVRDTTRAKSFIAESFSRNKVFPGLALRFAREAYREAAARSFQDRCEAAGSLGVVLAYSGNNAEAERYLIEGEKTALPTATELFLALGSVQEKMGKKNEAFDTYLYGLTMGKPTALVKPLLLLQKEIYPHASLDSLISAAQRRWVDFFPEKYERPDSLDELPNQKVVFAELFTGAECRPCQAADIAYNKLLERYDRSALVVLEYHLHIPRPDPLTNGDTELRSKYYDVNSTPTSIIDGTDITVSGGPGFAARAKFAGYADDIDRTLNLPAKASIKMSAKIRRNRISFAVSASVGAVRKTYKLRVALAEDEIRYQGGNGISEHRFVVRKMIRGAGGISFVKNGRAAIKDAFTVSSVEDQLEKYLVKYEKNEGKPGGVFKERKSELDPKQLFIVAFVQDDANHRILQSSIIKVKR
jgi:tetratricopeptide (TPR) repeat protein